MGELTGKAAVITGASGQIGSAVCHRFAEAGARIIASDCNENGLTELLTALNSGETARCGSHFGTKVDVMSSVSVRDLGKAVEMQCRGESIPTVVVQCAGNYVGCNGLASVTPEKCDALLNGHLKATFLVCQTFIGLMRQHNATGSIVNLSSLAADGWAQSPIYSAAKAGVVGFTKAIAKEFAPHGIRANVVLPGPVGHKIPAEVAALVPIGRVARTQEIAELCLFLASDKASYITGAAHYITGGMSW